MKTRVGPPPDGVEYPVWAWFMQNSKHKKPDLRSERWDYGRGDEDYSCIEIEVADNQVLLSDFDDWHYVLNNWLITDSEEERDHLEAYFETLSSEAQKELLHKDWERILIDSPLNNDKSTCASWVQATFWELRKEMIRDVRFFRTARRKHDD